MPEELAEPHTSAIWASLAHEMGLAHSVLDGDLGAVGLHVQIDDPEHMQFNTRLDPGPVTEMISVAFVMAQPSCFQNAAGLLDWTIDSEPVDGLLTEARALNSAAAHGMAEV